MANKIPQQAQVSGRGGPWSTGTGFSKSASGSDDGAGAGGPAVKAKKPMTMDNKRNSANSRIFGSTVHHNGGTHSIPRGSTNPPR